MPLQEELPQYGADLARCCGGYTNLVATLVATLPAHIPAPTPPLPGARQPLCPRRPATPRHTTMLVRPCSSACASEHRSAPAASIYMHTQARRPAAGAALLRSMQHKLPARARVHVPRYPGSSRDQGYYVLLF